LISGTPTVNGSFSVAITMTDALGGHGTITLPLTVNPPLTITTTSLPNGDVGQPYSFQLAATGGLPPYTWAGTGIPAGLTISAAGLISGTPTAAAGTYSITVTDTDQGG
jgi:hypothetical protein